MNNFVISAEGNLRIIALHDIPADTDFANIIGEVIGDIDTDDPLIALRNPSPCISYRDFIWTPLFEGGGIVRLSELRGEM